MTTEKPQDTAAPTGAASALSAGLGDADSWEANAQYMLERCPYTVWQRPGGGLVDLKATLVVTFQGMQMRLQGHPMFATPNVKVSGPEAALSPEGRARLPGSAAPTNEAP